MPYLRSSRRKLEVRKQAAGDRSALEELFRRYRQVALWNVAAAAISIASWQAGLAMAAVGLLIKLLPPETPRYRTIAPTVEGED